jgi:hypothetical protein
VTSLESPSAGHAAASDDLAATEAAPLHSAAWGPRVRWSFAIGVLAFVALLLFWRLSGFGIWDPWELAIADAARKLVTGEAVTGRTPFGTWLVGFGFRAFGVHEWAGRLPIACCALAAVIGAYQIGARFVDPRTGAYAALITGTSPLFLFNARMMMGAAPDIAVQTGLGLATLSALYPSTRASNAMTRGLWLIAALIMSALAITTRGALLGALPPLAAGVLVALLDVRRATTLPSSEPERRLKLPLLGLGALTLVSAGLILRDVLRDAPEYSHWLGGAASGGITAPTFDSVVEQVFHTFCPWSALLPIALSREWFARNTPATDPEERAPLDLAAVCLLWAALGYAAQTLFVARYGREVTYLPIVPLALLVAMTLRDAERRSEGSWAAGIAVLLLSGLLIRDFALYPNGPTESLPIAGFELPKVWNPARAWSALLVPFGACALLAFGSQTAGADKPRWSAPYRLLREQWRRDLGSKIWLSLGALVLLGVCVVSLLAFTIPARLHMPTLAIKWVRRLILVPLALPIAVALLQGVSYSFGRLGSYRMLPVLLLGAASGAYAAQGFLPRLSDHFSPREVYAVYNELAGPNEPLGEYRVGGRAAAYYANGPVIEVTQVAKLVDHLAGSGQRWAAFLSDDLAEIDHAFRKRTGKHLFLVDAHSARLSLAASQPVANRRDENPLRDTVRSAAPTIQHPIEVSFDDRVRLLGYDLKLPHENYVGAGESFTLTWYFRTLRRIAPGYRIFVHIDGEGERIHGDHDPLDGKYPVQLWDEGDVLADEQKIDVPTSYRGGDYAILIGFYSGDTRLPILEGPNDGENRASVGALRIR